MVHLRAINIPKEALLPGSELTLVLTADPKVFWDAPLHHQYRPGRRRSAAKQDAAVLE